MTPSSGDVGYARKPRSLSAGVASLVGVGVLLAALRVEPQVWGDPGVWLSVAARLLEGDRLYADVFDNKDPLFFYSYAAALRVGGVRGPFVLEILWLAIAACGLALALRTLRAKTPAVLAGSIVYPLALTAAWYVPGATMVPALAVAPWALWLWARSHAMWAGAVVVATMLVKLNLGLVVAAPLVALLAFRETGASRRRRACEATVGGALALLAAAAILIARGELGAYMETVSYNVYYAGSGVDGGGIGVHLDIVRTFFAASGKWQLPALGLACAALGVVACVGWLRLGQDFRRLSAVALLTLAAAFVTLSLTALFGVHLQMLAYPAALGAATLVAGLAGLWRPLGVFAAVTCVLFALWSSLKHEDLSKLTIRTWTTPPLSTPGLALEGTRARLFAEDDRVSYAVFGRNTEDGHAAFASHELDLRCRLFHQYPFFRQAQLDEAIECARREQPTLVLVTTSLYDPIPGEPAWEAFVASVVALLESRYQLVTEEGMSQVWRRR